MKKLAAGILCAALLLGMCGGVFAQEQEDIQAQRVQYETQLSELKREQERLEIQIESGEDVLNAQRAYRETFVREAETIEAQMKLIARQMDNVEETLAQKQSELEEKVLRLAQTEAVFRQRLVAMYTMHEDTQLTALLGVKSWAQMLRYAENLSCISKRDVTLMQQLRAERDALNVQTVDADALVEELTKSEAELLRKVGEYATAIAAADERITAAEAENTAMELALASNKARQEEAAEEWFQFVQATDVGFEFDGEPFYWPLPEHFRISSNYGLRTLFGRRSTHRGIDIPAALGTPVYAAATGVAFTTAHWTYGTCVKLSHGSGLVTVYGHLVARAVSTGQLVQKGELIGYVGSTGRSTGYHLHFETNLDGVAVDALNYIEQDVIDRLYTS